MFDFRSMLPENMRHDFDAAAQAERERAAHAAACTLPLCDRCGRLACSSPGCGKLAVDGTSCRAHVAEQLAEQARAHREAMVLEQIPEAFREASLDAPWLARLVGSANLEKARSIALGRGWVTAYSPRSGAGKTSLVAAMVRERARRDVVWTTARALATASAYAKLGEEPPALAAARGAGLLVVDELGTEADRFGASVADVVMDRHDLRRDVWITTPHTGAQLAARYGSGLVRRLTDNGETLHLRGGQ